MRGTKWLSIITFVFCCIAFAGVVVFYNQIDAKLIYDISLATFGSALLGFVMSLIQYFDAKRNAMELFYQEALKAISIIGKAQYFLTDEPESLVVNCIAEEVANKCNQQFFLPLTHESKDKLIEAYSATFPDEIDVDNPDFVKHLDEWYANKMQSYYTQLEKCFQAYISISTARWGDLDNAYGNLNFFFANQTIRKQAFDSVCNPIHKLKESVARQSYHFQLYMSGEGNISACTAFLLELNKEWFAVKEVNREEIHSIVVYRERYNILLEAVEKFRCKIYRQKYKAEVANPVISKIYHIEHKE